MLSVLDGDNDGGVGVVVCVAECFDGGVESAGRLAVEPGREHGSVSPSIASIGGTPYVAWQEFNGSAFQVRVAQFAGGAWTAVGGSLNVDPTKDANSPTPSGSAAPAHP